MHKRISFLLLLLALTTTSRAQAVMDNNPASLKWKQIKTPGFRIIYPEGAEKSANHVANTLEHIREPEMRTMGPVPNVNSEKPLKGRVPIVLQANHSVSNGFVTLSPFRSEFYTMPTQDYNFTGTNNWLELLAIHEYRHIAQFHRSRTGFNKIFHFLFGQNTQAAFSAMAAPRWFWEGDATLIETAMTPSGRGRIPEFDRVFRSNLLEGRRFNYNKQHLRSFRHFIPDHYRLGFYFVGHIRRKTGDPHIWDKVSKSAFGLPFVPFTFSNALKRHTGSYLVNNHNEMMDVMAKQYLDQIEGLQPTAYETITSRTSDVFTDYSTPVVLEDGSIVAFKSGLSDMGQLVRLDKNGNEIDRFITGIMNNTGQLTATQYKVFWNEYEFDPRWRARTYSVIKSHDFITGETKRITKKSRYNGAAVSPDGYKVATVLNTESDDNYIVIIDTFSGRELQRITSDVNAEYSMLHWSKSGLVGLKVNEDGKSVILIDLENDQVKELIEPSRENIGNPALVDNWIVFSSPFNGIDNIYAQEITTGERYQLTRSKYGAYAPKVAKGSLVYANHTANGLDVVTTSFSPTSGVPMGKVIDRNFNFIDPVVEQEGGDLTATIPNKKFTSQRYSKFLNMFNIHSWGPFASTDLNTAQIGIFSRDVLSTTRTSLGYTYDITEQTGFASARLSYQNWYPIIDLQYDFGSRRSSSYEWDETTFTTGVSLPLLLTRNRFSQSLIFANNVGLRQVSNFQTRTGNEGRDDFFVQLPNDNNSDSIFFYLEDTRFLDDGELIFNNLSLSYTNLMKRAPRNIASRWGQFLVIEHYTAIGGDFSGSLFGIRGGLFFPSPFELLSNKLFINHSLSFRFGSQSRTREQEPNNYSFRNVIFKPRGYSYSNEKSFSTFQGNYELPLLYPDLSLGPILYIKRLRLNLFYDYGQEQIEEAAFASQPARPSGRFQTDDFVGLIEQDNTYQSYGAELTFDLNLMRFPLDINVGVRLVTTNAIDANNLGGTQLEVILGGINF